MRKGSRDPNALRPRSTRLTPPVDADLLEAARLASEKPGALVRICVEAVLPKLLDRLRRSPPGVIDLDAARAELAGLPAEGAPVQSYWTPEGIEGAVNDAVHEGKRPQQELNMRPLRLLRAPHRARAESHAEATGLPSAARSSN